jgi:hypothetical protein
MSRSYVWRVLLVVALAGVLATINLPARVLGQGADVGAVSSPQGPTAAAVMAFWTAERMAAAQPAPMPRPQRQATAPRAIASTGTPMYVPPVAPGQAATTGVLVGQVAGTPSPVVTYYTYPYPFDRTGAFPFTLYNGPLGTLGSFPWITNAKVFFQNAAYGSGGFVCSGTVVNSGTGGNRRLVWTAGHCVNSGGTTGGAAGTWSTNVMVCPAYRDGNSPVGCWPHLQLFTLGGWHSDSNLRRDQGVIVTGLSSGWRIQDRVGAMGLTWNQARRQHWWEFGYPQASPFNGNRLIFCTSSLGRDDAPNSLAGPETLGVGCDMTGGSSGGGWLLSFTQGGGGFVNSVNSYKYIIPAEPLAMYGPYFDVGTENLYNASRTTFP